MASFKAVSLLAAVLLVLCATQVDSFPSGTELSSRFKPSSELLGEAMSTIYSVCHTATEEGTKACNWHRSKVFKIMNRMFTMYRVPKGGELSTADIARLIMAGRRLTQTLEHEDQNVLLLTASQQIISYCAVNLQYCRHASQIIKTSYNTMEANGDMSDY